MSCAHSRSRCVAPQVRWTPCCTVDQQSTKPPCNAFPGIALQRLRTPALTHRLRDLRVRMQEPNLLRERLARSVKPVDAIVNQLRVGMASRADDDGRSLGPCLQYDDPEALA